MEQLKLTQEWDKVFPKSDKVEYSKATFHNRYGITLAADVYVPKNAEGKLPAIAVSGPFGAVKEQSSGLYAQKMAELGFFTMAYCYCPQEARLLADAGVDIIVSHVGLTAGGDVGVSQASPLEQAIEDTSAILSAALERRPDILPLCHGGAIVTPEDVQQVVRRTPAVGFVAASSIERLPVEGAVGQMVQALKGVVL